MNIFQKKFSTKPKKLSFREMWELYRFMDVDDINPTVIKETASVLERLSLHASNTIMTMFYGNRKISNPLEYGMLFMRGLVNNNYFTFRGLIRTLHGRHVNR